MKHQLFKYVGGRRDRVESEPLPVEVTGLPSVYIGIAPDATESEVTTAVNEIMSEVRGWQRRRGARKVA